MRAILKLAVYAALGMMLTCAVLQAQELFIVANKSVSLSQLNSGELRDLFTGAKSRLADGSRAVPVVLKGGPVHEVFLHRHVGDTPEEFRMRWRKLVFTGQGSMLKEFPSEAAMLEYVSVTPGAIGYVSRVGDPEAVKILTVQR
jgi:hypothetical protein